MSGSIKAVLATAGLLMALPGAQALEPVDVALVLAVDVSRSMSPQELAIQRNGYAAALNHLDVMRAIAQGAYGRFAITISNGPATPPFAMFSTGPATPPFAMFSTGQ